MIKQQNKKYKMIKKDENHEECHFYGMNFSNKEFLNIAQNDFYNSKTIK